MPDDDLTRDGTSTEQPETSSDARTFWDAQAATFDDEADHGLKDPATRAAWAALLDDSLGELSGPVADLGCGTGSVSVLLTQRGHQVLGLDVSPKMVEQANAKARAGELDIEFIVGDVQIATVPTRAQSAVVCRHLLWAVEDPAAVVQRWSAPLTEDGVFIAIEGVWGRAGTDAEVVFTTLQTHFQNVEYTDLSAQDVLWGKHVTDHRYAIVGRYPRAR